MSNREYLNAYKASETSMNLVKSSHDIIYSLMFQLSNSMEKIALDINEGNKNKTEYIQYDNKTKKNLALKKSKNMSKSLSIIYGLQTCLDFDKSLEISTNLFQLYEYCRQEIIKGFSQKLTDGIYKAINVMKEILEGWKQIPASERKI